MNKTRSIRLRLQRSTLKTIAGADLASVRAGDGEDTVEPATGINSGGGNGCRISEGIHQCSDSFAANNCTRPQPQPYTRNRGC